MQNKIISYNKNQLDKLLQKFIASIERIDWVNKAYGGRRDSICLENVKGGYIYGYGYNFDFKTYQCKILAGENGKNCYLEIQKNIKNNDSSWECQYLIYIGLIDNLFNNFIDLLEKRWILLQEYNEIDYNIEIRNKILKDILEEK